MIASKSSSADCEAGSSPEQVEGPSHQLRSTPVWKTPIPAVTSAAAAPASGASGFRIQIAATPMATATTCG